MISRLPANRTDLCKAWFLFALYSFVAAVNFGFHTPTMLDFEHFAFGDPGSNLYAHHLIWTGFRPTIDFTFPYGLAGLAIGETWFGTFGLTPYSFSAFVLLCSIGICAALADMTAQIGVTLREGLLLAAMIPFAVNPTPPSLTHCLESLSLVVGLSLQLRRRYSAALAMAVVGVAIKPSINFFFGALLLLVVLREILLAGDIANVLAWWRYIRTAVIILAALGTVLALRYGVQPLLNTLLPITGRTNYIAMHYGFWGPFGRNFWHPAGARVGYYIGTFAGSWLLATSIICLACGAWAFGHLKISRTSAELLFSVTLLHVAFLLVLFGNTWSWAYYSYLPVLGLLALLKSPGPGKYMPACVCILAVTGLRADFVAGLARWHEMKLIGNVAGLWMSDEQRADSAGAAEIAAAKPTVFLSSAGWPSAFIPRVNTPIRWMCLRGLINPIEVRDIRRSIDSSSVVLVHLPEPADDILTIPEIKGALAAFHKVGQRPTFTIWTK